LCNLCGSDDPAPLFEAKDRLHGSEEPFTYVRCKRCGLVYMNPQIARDEIAAFYPATYNPFQSQPKRQLSDEHKLRRAARRRPFGTFICKKLNRQSRLLDVGCGSGGFLHEMRILTGCQTFGLDISQLAAKAAIENYGLDIHVGTILAAPFPEKYFDVITAWEYLEHVDDPSGVLSKMSSLLKNDGSCVISTPNFDSFNRRLFKDRWYALDCPRHLYLYSPTTIGGLLRKNGLSVQKIKYDKSSKGILGSLQYYFYGDNYNPAHTNRIRRSSFLRKIASPIARISALLRQSDTMAIHAKKTI
jgi:2-polyprenyl-3-methyl-5-hydroxy-6-metoxy-1,4-benzoquinol methylase